MKQTEFERLNIDYAEIQDQATAEDLIPKLIAAEARHAWVHINPLLGPINFQRQWLEKLNWVTISGDAGQNANPCNVEWIRSIIRQCAEAKVACYVKRLGSNPVCPWPMAGCDGSSGLVSCLTYGIYTRTPGFPDTVSSPITHRRGGDPSEWPEDLRVRQIPEVKP